MFSRLQDVGRKDGAWDQFRDVKTIVVVKQPSPELFDLG